MNKPICKPDVRFTVFNASNDDVMLNFISYADKYEGIVMSLEADPALLELSKTLLLWLGVPSLAGFLSLYAAWLAFPPELVIEAVVDKSKKFNSESRIKIKNNGRLPALGIKADAENISARIDGLSMKHCGIFNGPNVVGRLSCGESAEISVSPGVGFGQCMQITEFSYLLTLKHHAKLFFFRKEFKKQWKIELRNFQDGFAWHVIPA